MSTIANYGPGFDVDYERRAMPRALVEGLTALVRDARPGSSGGIYGSCGKGAQIWAWPQPGEMEMREEAGVKSETIYHFKIRAARLENVWRETMSQTAAVPFRNQPTLEGWPASIQGGFDQSVDDQGRSLYEYWVSTFFHKIAYGISFTLLDMPAPNPDGTSTGGNAYWVELTADQVLEVVVQLSGGILRPVEARVKCAPTASAFGQPVSDDPEKWERAAPQSFVRVYRVSERVPPSETAPDDDEPAGAPGGPVRFREAAEFTAEDGKSKKWGWVDPSWRRLQAKLGRVFTEIPLIPHYAERTGPYRGSPPFQDTASVQMALWRRGLDYDERVRRDARNIVAIAGAKPGDSSYDGSVYWLPGEAVPTLLETSGAALKALRDDQEVMRDHIRRGNLRPILAKPQVSQTATEIMVSSISGDSKIETWIILDIAAFTRALRMTALLNGEEAGDDAVLNMPHDVSLSPEAMASLWDGYIKGKGAVPPGLLWREASRHQWIGEREDPEALARQAAALTVPPAPPPPPTPPAG